MISQLGISDSSFEATADLVSTGRFTGLYDENGHQVCDEDYAAVGEDGYITGGHESLHHIGPASNTGTYWKNSTGTYEVFNTPDGENYEKPGLSFAITDSLGVLALVVVLVILASVIGVRFLSTGESDTSIKTIVVGTGLVTLWAFFSYLAMPIITTVFVLGPIFYLLITVLYALGVIQSIGGSEA